VAFPWDKYLDLALELAESEAHDQASLRSAVSRAYYAAYNPCKDFLVSAGRLHTDAKHEDVWRALSTASDRAHRKVGSEGDRLKRARVAADYVSRNLISKELAKQSCERASTIYFLMNFPS
jgi:uncharacterized protein (UPF0332 family)